MDLVTTVLGLAIAWALFRRPGRPRRPRRGPCYPLVWRPPEIHEAIVNVFESGDCDVDEAAAAVAAYVYPELPGGVAATWPPAPDAEEGQQCIWSRIIDEIHKVAKLRGVQLCRVGEPASTHRPPDAGVSINWGDVVDKYNSGGAPNHGFIYQVRPRGESEWAEDAETLSKVSTATLMNAFDEIGMDPQLALQTDDEGVRYMIRDMSVLIECAPINDTTYGTPASELGSKNNPGSGHYAPHGRGISFNPVHADNMARMREGLPMLRTVVRGGRMDGTDAEHDGRGGHPPTLWIPLLNLDELAEGRVTTADMYWPNGESTIMPPPEIMALGRPENVPPGRWGCDGLEVP